MKYTVLLNSTQNKKDFEDQEQARFIKSILDCLELSVDFNPDIKQTTEQKIKFKHELQKYKISIISDYDGGLKIFVDADLIAEWKKCKYKLKVNEVEKDPKNKLYLEAQVDFQSVFEEQDG